MHIQTLSTFFQYQQCRQCWTHANVVIDSPPVRPRHLQSGCCYLQAKLTNFTAAVRLQLRSCLAQHACLSVSQVSIEGIKSGPRRLYGEYDQQPGSVIASSQKGMTAEPSLTNSSSLETTTAVNIRMQDAAVQSWSRGVTVAVHIQLGGAKSQGQQLAAALQHEHERVLADNAMNAAIGPVDAANLQAEVVDVSPVLANSSLTRSQAEIKRTSQHGTSQSKELVQVKLCWKRLDRAHQTCWDCSSASS